MAGPCERTQRTSRDVAAQRVYEELVNAPDTRVGDSPISRLAEHVAVDPIGFDWNAPHTDRMWTNGQRQLRLYKHRFFTTGQAFTKGNIFCDVSASCCYIVFLLSIHILAWSSRPPACDAKAVLDQSSQFFDLNRFLMTHDTLTMCEFFPFYTSVCTIYAHRRM